MIGLVIPAVAVAVAVALLQRGTGGERCSVRWPGLAALALGIQLVLFNPPADSQSWALAWGRWIYVATLLGVMAVLLRNALVPDRARAPWLVAALGVALNLAVIVANNGLMPRSDAALAASGGTPRRDDRLSNVAPLTAETRLAWLGDIIPEPDWLPLTNVLSVGDLLLAAGTAWALARRSMPRPSSGI